MADWGLRKKTLERNLTTRKLSSSVTSPSVNSWCSWNVHRQRRRCRVQGQRRRGGEELLVVNKLETVRLTSENYKMTTPPPGNKSICIQNPVDVGILSNTIGSLSLANGQCPRHLSRCEWFVDWNNGRFKLHFCGSDREENLANCLLLLNMLSVTEFSCICCNNFSLQCRWTVALRIFTTISENKGRLLFKQGTDYLILWGMGRNDEFRRFFPAVFRQIFSPQISIHHLDSGNFKTCNYLFCFQSCIFWLKVYPPPLAKPNGPPLRNNHELV